METSVVLEASLEIDCQGDHHDRPTKPYLPLARRFSQATEINTGKRHSKCQSHTHICGRKLTPLTLQEVLMSILLLHKGAAYAVVDSVPTMP